MALLPVELRAAAAAEAGWEPGREVPAEAGRDRLEGESLGGESERPSHSFPLGVGLGLVLGLGLGLGPSGSAILWENRLG